MFCWVSCRLLACYSVVRSRVGCRLTPRWQTKGHSASEGPMVQIKGTSWCDLAAAGDELFLFTVGLDFWSSMRLTRSGQKTTDRMKHHCRDNSLFGIWTFTGRLIPCHEQSIWTSQNHPHAIAPVEVQLQPLQDGVTRGR